MTEWKIKQTVKNLPKLNSPILLEGLPGIGNVGKVAVDFLVDNTSTKKIIEFISYSFPHSVFVNEENIIEMPSIEIYALKRKGKKYDLLFLTGDVQPIDEESCYKFSEAVLDVLASLNGKEIITTGGIGLASIPKVPRVFCTGNTKKIFEKYKEGTKLNTELYGRVGPIVGVSGVLLGLAKRRSVDAVCLLAETIGHPMYLGIRGAKEIIKVLSKKLDFEVNLNELNREIKDIETELLRHGESGLATDGKLRKIKSKHMSEVSYIG